MFGSCCNATGVSDDLSYVFDFTEGNDPIDQHLIDLFTVAKSTATTEELAAEHTIVAAMLSAMAPVPTNVIPLRSSIMRQRFATTKTATKAVIISGVVLFSATAAAAGGVLPHAAQSAVSRAVEHVGIHVDNPDKSAQRAEDATSTSSTIDDSSATSSSVEAVESNDDSSKSNSAVGPDATGSSHDGLCESFLEHQNNPAKAEDSVAAKNLADAAAKAGQTVAVFCATTTTSVDDHATSGHGVDDTSSTVAGNSTSGKNGVDTGSHNGLDDTTQTTTVSVPDQVDPAVTSSSIDDKGASNKGGNPKP